ncbi:helix-turn-helix transcriptional regulator [Brevundimonas sp.]|uniref:helix-turn-helix domain-containing protein n=1 Tax=Brevundimonas sp. TaxID=1871086 RepID=UPI001D9CC52D|nr:helix-turn-helix transcriptional regulator [Brevundimonas sp.]MBL0947112.1 helix-turn-helix transcriptional regulator [Brevundimonas sp.]
MPWNPDLSEEDERQVEALVTQIGERVQAFKAFRLALGLSQVEMAELLGVTQSNVSKMEAARDPKLAVLRKLVEARGGRLTLHAHFDDRDLVLPL